MLQGESYAGRGQVLGPEQMRRLLASENHCRSAARAYLAAVRPEGTQRLEARVDALWSMLAGVAFFFTGHPRRRAVTAEARRLLLRALT